MTPSPAATMDVGTIGQIWNVGKGMIGDVIDIVSANPLLIITLIAIPLVGLGIGLFKRLVH